MTKETINDLPEGYKLDICGKFYKTHWTNEDKLKFQYERWCINKTNLWTFEEFSEIIRVVYGDNIPSHIGNIKPPNGLLNQEVLGVKVRYILDRYKKKRKTDNSFKTEILF